MGQLTFCICKKRPETEEFDKRIPEVYLLTSASSFNPKLMEEES